MGTRGPGVSLSDLKHSLSVQTDEQVKQSEVFLKVKERSHGRSGAELESLTVYTVYYRRGADEE